MTKQEKFLWFLALIALGVVFLFNLLIVHPAGAAEPKQQAVTTQREPIPLISVRNQYKVWTRDLRLSTGAGHHIQATITTEYYYWKGWRGTKWQGHWITPYGVDLCYTWKDDGRPSLLWQGITADSEWFDSRLGIMVQDFRSWGGPGDRQHCEHEKVPLEHRVWLRAQIKNGVVANPFWLADGTVNWKGIPDQGFHWHSPRADDSKGLWPQKDPVISTKSGKIWHNIYKTW